jgi:hypothetical protein
MNQSMNDDQQILEAVRNQQEQINSLATSLQQMLLFFQDQGSKEESNNANLFAVSQESIKYLNALLNNVELVKQQTDIIKPGLILVQEAIKKTEGNLESQLDAISKGFTTIQQNQVKTYKIITTVQTKALSHESENNTWHRNIGSRSIALISIVIALTSGINFAHVTLRTNEIHTSLHREISVIQKQLRSKQLR